MRRSQIVMDDARLSSFFRQLALIDQRGVARLGVRCYVANEPGTCSTAEMRPLRRPEATPPPIPRPEARSDALAAIPALPSLRTSRNSSKPGRAARLFARLAESLRSAPPTHVDEVPGLAPLVEWSGPCTAFKKS